MFVELLGWTATAVFVASYFFTSMEKLRACQMGGAVLWIAYGAVLGSAPVVVANVLVFSAATWSMARVARQGAAVSG